MHNEGQSLQENKNIHVVLIETSFLIVDDTCLQCARFSQSRPISKLEVCGGVIYSAKRLIELSEGCEKPGMVSAKQPGPFQWLSGSGDRITLVWCQRRINT